MRLKSFLRGVTGIMFQPRITSITRTVFDRELGYEGCFFLLPRIICFDGFSLSLQINSGTYTTTENGYRKYGFEWEKAEFYISDDTDYILSSIADSSGVGCIEVDILQSILDKNHGGIDWDKTLSSESIANIHGFSIKDKFISIK